MGRALLGAAAVVAAATAAALPVSPARGGAIAAESQGAAAAVEWNGTVEGAGTVSGYQTCTGSWKGTIAFSVTGSTLDGGGAVDIGSPACSQVLPTPDITHVDFTITGTYESMTSGETRVTLFFHVQAVMPATAPVYDPSGFGAHFGQSNEGVALVLTATGNAIDQQLATTVPISNATVSLNDHFVLKRSCDPDLLDKALREYATGDSFAKAARDELPKALSTETAEFGYDYGKESLEVGAEKFSILQALKGVDSALEVTPLAAYADLAEGLEIAGIYGGSAVIVVDVYTKVIPLFREHAKRVKEASADLKRAETWWKRGNADLKQALAQGPCADTKAERELKRLEDDQAQKDKARALIDSWETNANGSLYVNPTTGEILDEGAALKAAAAMLKQARSIQVHDDNRAKILALRKRLQDALALVERAIADHRKVVGRIARFQSTTKTLVRRLGPLLKS